MSLRVVLFSVILVSIAALCLAETTAPPQAASSYLTPGNSYDYKVNIKISGDMKPAGAVESQKLDAVLDLTIRHKIAKGIGEDEIQSVMSVQTAFLTVNDQKIPLGNDTFPKVTIIADKNGNIKNVYGASGPGMPGLNFSNFILFLLPDPAKANSTSPEGTKWDKLVKLSDTRQNVKVTSLVKGNEKIRDKDTVLIEQTYELAPPVEGNPNTGVLKTFNGTAKTNYLTPAYRPMKSHAEIEVTSGQPVQNTNADNSKSSVQEREEYRAKLLIDLTAVM